VSATDARAATRRANERRRRASERASGVDGERAMVEECTMVDD